MPHWVAEENEREGERQGRTPVALSPSSRRPLAERVLSPMAEPDRPPAVKSSLLRLEACE
jgi:hypothetical protein